MLYLSAHARPHLPMNGSVPKANFSRSGSLARFKPLVHVLQCHTALLHLEGLSRLVGRSPIFAWLLTLVGSRYQLGGPEKTRL